MPSEKPKAPAGDEASEQQPAGPQVVPPEVIHHESPVYPPAALDAGLTASVVVTITIDEAGNVTDAVVEQPIGNGFDEAARDAALKLKFKPALVNGRPRAVRIQYQFDFTIEERVKEVEAPPEVGQLGGLLTVAGTDIPLAGVEVTVRDAQGQEYRVTTDADGRWALEGLPPGTYRVEAGPTGFVTVALDEEVVAGEATELTYRISPDTNELEILVGGERPPREVTRRTLQRREIERVPGTGGDALRSVQSLPGVARPPGLAGLLIIRGSAPEDTETFVDGTNVPLIYHFGGLTSVVPTELLDKIDFYPGNFSVRYGRLMGGVIDVGLRSPNTECYGDYGTILTDDQGRPRTGCFHGMAQVDLIDTRFLAQGPLGEDWSFAIGGRRSWIDAWLSPVLEEAGSSVTSAPVYYDYQVIVDRYKSPDDKLSLRFYGSNDRFEAIFNEPAAQDPAFGGSLRFGTSFYRAQALYQKALTDDVSLDAMLSAGHTLIDFSLGGNFLFELDIVPINFRSEFGFQVTDTARLNVGIDFLGGPFDVTVRAPPPPRPGEPDPGPFVTRQPLETVNTGFSFRPGWYTDLELQPTRRLRVVPGARLDHAQDSGGTDFSPRLNARYALVLPEDGFWGGRPLGTTIKGGVGVYQQPPQFQETDPVFGTPGLESNRAVHYSLGFEQDLTKQVQLSVEGFYKDLTNLVSRGPNAFGSYEYNNLGSGHVIGMETLLKYRPDARFFGWLTYTLSQSVRKDAPDDEERPFQFDQTHNLIILGSYRLGRGWEFGARFRVVSGPLDTPVVRPPSLPALFVADAGAYAPLEGELFSERLPLFHQLDVRVDKRWQFRAWRLNAYLDVQNVYNNAADETLLYNYNFSQQTFQTGLPIIPSIGVRGEF